MYHLLQVVLKDVIPPEAVPRCQAAWLRLEEPTRADWAARRATRFGEILPNGEVSANTDLGVMRTFFDVSGLCDAEEAYIDLVDNPITLPRCRGSAGTEGRSCTATRPTGMSPPRGVAAVWSRRISTPTDTPCGIVRAPDTHTLFGLRI